MKQNILKLFIKGSILISSFFAPLLAKAQENQYISNGLGDIADIFPGGPGLGGATTLTGRYGLIYRVIIMLLSLAGMVAVLFIIVGGFWYITSAGNEEQAEKGKSTLLNAIIGIIVIVLSFVIIDVISSYIASGL
jgi:hypothetical protein